MSRQRRGYRRLLCAPRKGRKPWRTGARKEVDRAGQFLGFDVPPTACHCQDSVRQPVSCLPLNSIRVLSLFDGICSGFVVLERLGLHVEKYFSSEISEKAITVQRCQFPQKVVPLGSVTNLSNDKLDSLGRIDLLLGGSPCQDLSLANPRRKGLLDPESSGSLFFEFHRILRHLQMTGRKNGTHLFWLFENTAAMERTNLQFISDMLGSEPVKICSSWYVPMRRPRNFWGNIPLMESIPFRKLQTVPNLQDFLQPFRSAAITTLPTITTMPHSQLTGKEKRYPVNEHGKGSLLYINEIELLFGFPKNHTGAGNLSVSDRRKLLGNAWCVHVVEDILRPLRVFFKEEVHASLALCQ